MNKKDYVKFAALFAGELALANVGDREDRLLTVRAIIKSMADIFAQDNPSFDRQKFYEACEPKE